MKPQLRREAEEKLRAWGVSVPENAWSQLDSYLGYVLEYNKKTNLTAAKDQAELVRRHGLDAWAALAPLQARTGAAPRILDVGAGGGFIGIGLKIARPEAEITLIETVYRKFVFLNAACARIGLPGLTPVQERAGKGFKGAFDVVVSRALAPLPQALKWQLPLTRPGGWTVVYQSERPDAQNPELARIAANHGARWEEAFSYRLPGEEKDRYLALLRREL